MSSSPGKRSGHPSVELCLNANERRFRLPGQIDGRPIATTEDPERQCSDLAAFREAVVVFWSEMLGPYALCPIRSRAWSPSRPTGAC